MKWTRSWRSTWWCVRMLLVLLMPRGFGSTSGGGRQWRWHMGGGRACVVYTVAARPNRALAVHAQESKDLEGETEEAASGSELQVMPAAMSRPAESLQRPCCTVGLPCVLARRALPPHAAVPLPRLPLALLRRGRRRCRTAGARASCSTSWPRRRATWPAPSTGSPPARWSSAPLPAPLHPSRPFSLSYAPHAPPAVTSQGGCNLGSAAACVLPHAPSQPAPVIPPCPAPQRRDKYGQLGRGRLLRIAADKMKRAAGEAGLPPRPFPGPRHRLPACAAAGMACHATEMPGACGDLPTERPCCRCTPDREGGWHGEGFRSHRLTQGSKAGVWQHAGADSTGRRHTGRRSFPRCSGSACVPACLRATAADLRVSPCWPGLPQKLEPDASLAPYFPKDACNFNPAIVRRCLAFFCSLWSAVWAPRQSAQARACHVTVVLAAPSCTPRCHASDPPLHPIHPRLAPCCAPPPCSTARPAPSCSSTPPASWASCRSCRQGAAACVVLLPLWPACM